jgi:FkbM family methyltransferase
MGDDLMKFEEDYFNNIKNECKIVFDVGVGDFSVFFDKVDLEVHYFEPFSIAYNKLKEINISNINYQLNNFGLSNNNTSLPFYIEGSLFDRNLSKEILEICEVKKGLEYCIENNISKIDFLKIDVEGLETKVLQGFGDFLHNIKYIQFKYGIGLRDAGSNLSEIFNLLLPYGFSKFYKQTPNGLILLNNSNDFWEWCNICTYNENLI